MKKSIFFLVAGLLLGLNVRSQTLTHTPFIGAFQPTSARLYTRTDAATPVTALVSKNATDFTGALSFSGATDANLDNTGILNLTGLDPDTKYFYKVQINGADASGVQSFFTSPADGAKNTFTFAFGSCQSFKTLPPVEKVFTQIGLDNPRFFLQCGDWGYPDTTDAGGQNFFSEDFQRVVNTYRARYQGTITDLMKTTAFDYIYDDHDYANDNSSRSSSSSYTGSTFGERPFPPSCRRNAIDGYSKFYPHYDLVDTSNGIYHSFKYGNVEVFMLDNRADRSPNLNSLKLDTVTGLYTFDPPPGHTIIGAQQMQWLLDGLKNSTATWKFIVGGVSFNKGYERVINEVSGNAQLQNFDPSGIPGVPPGSSVKSVLGAIIDTWAGFPEDQNKVLKHLADNDIKNVIFLSSDSHTSAIDDGANAGMPECMAGNLNQTNSRLAQLMSQVKDFGPILGIPIEADLNVWNAGAQGVGNSNLNNAYGRINIYGDDSLRMSIIDENGVQVATLKLLNTIGTDTTDTIVDTPNKVNTLLKRRQMFELYPNPAKNQITVLFDNPEVVKEGAKLMIYDVIGRPIKQMPSTLHLTGKQIVDVSDLPDGYYYMIVHQKTGNLVKSFRVN